MSKKEFTVNDQDWAHELEKGVETYTDMLFEAVWDDGVQKLQKHFLKNHFVVVQIVFGEKHCSS